MQGVLSAPKTDQVTLYGSLRLNQLMLPPPAKASRGPLPRHWGSWDLHSGVPMGPELHTQLKKARDPTGGRQGSLSHH